MRAVCKESVFKNVEEATRYVMGFNMVQNGVWMASLEVGYLSTEKIGLDKIHCTV